MRRHLPLTVFLVACGASSPPATQTSTAECTEAEALILRDIASSLERLCEADAECVAITSPHHFSEEFNEVVHTADAAALRARSRAHLDRCGATIHHEEGTDAFRVVSAVCEAHRCTARETNFHIEE